jgi:hypothetical protein
MVAEPHTCTRCSGSALLAIVGRCAACIGEMGLRSPEEYGAWKADVNAEYGRK